MFTDQIKITGVNGDQSCSIILKLLETVVGISDKPCLDSFGQ